METFTSTTHTYLSRSVMFPWTIGFIALHSSKEMDKEQSHTCILVVLKLRRMFSIRGPTKTKWLPYWMYMVLCLTHRNSQQCIVKSFQVLFVIDKKWQQYVNPSISKKTLSKYETGKQQITNFSFSWLHQIARFKM